MKVTKLFTKTLKGVSKEEVSINAKFLTRGGFIHKEMAGVYTFLPLGLKVLKKIERIVIEEMDRVGGQQIMLSSIQNKSLWEKSGRWSDEVVDVWFKSKFNAGGEIGFAASHEEPLTNLLTKYIKSYADLPIVPYQIQTKFRNELRAKSGIMRGREFIMKDMYSFHADSEDLEKYYNKIANAYHKVFERVGLGDKTFYTVASGGMFVEGFSHEFQIVCPTGEDTIFLDRKKKIAINKEVYNDETIKEFKLNKDELEEVSASEVGNIFKLGVKYSKPLGLTFVDKEGNVKNVIMGCYGIGVSRLMGVIVEVCSDEKGIVWPEAVAPYKVYIVSLGKDGDKVSREAEKLYQDLISKGVEVLIDDRNVSAGQKFADADLIGIPYRVVVSEKSLSQGGVELKRRSEAESKIVPLTELKL